MNEILTQSWMHLLLAALLGGVIGWLSYQRMRGGASSEAESRLRAEIDKFRAEAGNLRHSLTVEQEKVKGSESAAAALQGRLTAALAASSAHQAELSGLRGAVDSGAASLATVTADLASCRKAFANLEPQVARKEADAAAA